MNFKQKLIAYFNDLMISSFVLWIILIILSLSNYKLDIIAGYFLVFSELLFLILYLRQIVVFLVQKLNKLNYFLKATDKPISSAFLTTRMLLLNFMIQLLILLKGFPQLFMFLIANRIFWYFITILGIVFDIYIFKFAPDPLTVILTVLWIILVFRFKDKGKNSLIAGIGFLALCAYFLNQGENLLANKAIFWVYMFIVVGIFRLFLENFKEE